MKSSSNFGKVDKSHQLGLSIWVSQRLGASIDLSHISWSVVPVNKPGKKSVQSYLVLRVRLYALKPLWRATTVQVGLRL